MQVRSIVLLVVIAAVFGCATRMHVKEAEPIEIGVRSVSHYDYVLNLFLVRPLNVLPGKRLQVTAWVRDAQGALRPLSVHGTYRFSVLRQESYLSVWHRDLLAQYYGVHVVENPSSYGDSEVDGFVKRVERWSIRLLSVTSTVAGRFFLFPILFWNILRI